MSPDCHGDLCAPNVSEWLIICKFDARVFYLQTQCMCARITAKVWNKSNIPKVQKSGK